MTGSFVYIVEAENGLVKIGVSTDPTRRAKDFYIHSPVLVRLVAFWPGSREDEQALHAQFSSCRNHCEWFRSGGALTAFVESKRGQNVPAIPEWNDLTYFGESRKERHRDRIGTAQRQAWADPDKRRERLVNRRAHKRYQQFAGKNAYHPNFNQPLFDKAVAEISAEYDLAASRSEGVVQ